MKLLFLCAVVLVGCSQADEVTTDLPQGYSLASGAGDWYVKTNGISDRRPNNSIEAARNHAWYLHYVKTNVRTTNIVPMNPLPQFWTNTTYLVSYVTNDNRVIGPQPYSYDSTNWHLCWANGFQGPVSVNHEQTNRIVQYGIDYSHPLSLGEPWDTNKLHIGATLSTVLTTNVSERFPTLQSPPDTWTHNKWTRTTVRRQTFVDFTVQGTPFKGLLKEEVLSDNEVEYVLERTDKWRVK